MNDVTEDPGARRGSRRLIAPLWHTAVLVALFFAIAGYGVYLQNIASSKQPLVEHRGSAIPLYLSLIAAQWALFRFVTAAGLKRTGTRFRDLLGDRWASWRDVARDAAIALAVWAAWTAVTAAVERSMGSDTARGIATLLPRGPLEVTVWVALSVTAGFCEEAIFRGYLQKQLEALIGNSALAILGQAVVFGIAHGYQGIRNVVAITIYGVLFGTLAWWRKSLKPGMILHAWTDIFGGIFARAG